MQLRLKETRNACKIFKWKLGGKRPFGRPWRLKRISGKFIVRMGSGWNWLRILAIGGISICDFDLLVSATSVN
jgi:hypothetical protein